MHNFGQSLSIIFWQFLSCRNLWG